MEGTYVIARNEFDRKERMWLEGTVEKGQECTETTGPDRNLLDYCRLEETVVERTGQEWARGLDKDSSNKKNGLEETELDKNRPECTWSGRTRIDRSGLHRSGQNWTQRTGLDRSGQEQTGGQDWTGSDWTEPERTGLDMSGWIGQDDRTGQERTGLDRSGQVWSGADRTGQERTGLDRRKQDWTERTGLDRSGQNRTGLDRTGLDRSGQDWTGADKRRQGRRQSLTGIEKGRPNLTNRMVNTTTLWPNRRGEELRSGSLENSFRCILSSGKWAFSASGKKHALGLSETT